jgi:hypothetical protein
LGEKRAVGKEEGELVADKASVLVGEKLKERNLNKRRA